MIAERQLLRDEIEKIWSIDRSELIDAIYILEAGKLVLRPAHYDIRHWPSEEIEKYTPILVECFDRGGWFRALFDGSRLVGVAILDNRWLGERKDQLQLEFLYISQGYRGQSLGRQLFDKAKVTAHERGAKRLYVSATPSEHTINFYVRQGCTVMRRPDPELFAREPEDIHLECNV